MEETIISRENQFYKQMRGLLTSKKERDAAGLFVCEGARLCADALDAGMPLQTLLVTQRALSRYPQAELLRKAARRAYLISEELAAKAGDTETPQGVFGVFGRLDKLETADTIIKKGTKFLLLHSLRDPGNVGSVLRGAAALGVSGVYISADSADPYSPKALRASMGGAFRVPFCVLPNLTAAITCLRENGVAVYAAALSERARPLRPGMLAGSAAVLIGNEGHGLPPELIECCDASVIIPMKNGSESLGAAMAAGILIWEMTRADLNGGE